jgi:AIPR protein
MANTANGSPAPSSVQLSYHLLRNTTSPDEIKTGVKSFVANFSAFEILKLNTKENLRAYLAEDNPKKRNRVHDAIKNTIQTEPQRFITRNSGFVIGAAAIEVDDNKKLISLADPSILNGAQSQGEIRRWVQETFGDELPMDFGDPPFYVRAEIIVDSDFGEVVETAIARNTATPVKSISQAGARGHLDELEESIKKVRPDIKIRKKETDEDVVDTRKILQYTRLLMPFSISQNESAAERLRPYKNPEQCLTEFSAWYESKETDAAARLKYDFTVQMAPYAIAEYEYWERHEGWNGHRLWEETKKGGRACRRDKDKKVVWVSPGLVFPIVGAISEFVEQQEPAKWVITKPKVFEPVEMIASAVKQFRGVDSDPMQMGRDAGVYDALRIYPRTLVKVMSDWKKAGSAA